MIRQELVDDLIQQGVQLVDELVDVIRTWHDGEMVDRHGIDRAFRALHTIKGSFGFIGMSKVAELAHAMEDSIADLREMLVNATPELLDLIDDGARVLREHIQDPGPKSARRLELVCGRLQRLQDIDGDDDPFEESPTQTSSQHWPLEPTHAQGARAQRLGQYIFRITLLHERDIEGRGRSPIDLSELLLALGDPLDIEVDLSSIAGLADYLEHTLTFQVLLMSESDAEQCAELLEIGPEQIEAIDLHDYIPQEFHTQRIIRNEARAAAGTRIDGGLKAMLQAMGNVAQDLAARVGKSVSVSIKTVDHPMPRELRQQLQGALAHLLRNAIDHGIEPADKRRTNGKRATGSIELEGSVTDGRIRLRIADDGAGIDPDLIIKRALADQVIDSDEGYRDDTQRALQLLFHPGFSTATSVSELSGRGMGMNVVERVAQEAGGSVWMNSEAGSGCEVFIDIASPSAL